LALAFCTFIPVLLAAVSQVQIPLGALFICFGVGKMRDAVFLLPSD
jgi:hypothetical protein